MAWIKRCACCGATYTSLAGWRSIELVGRMSDGDGGQLELRNCRCGSTIAIDAVLVDGTSAAMLADLEMVFRTDAAEEPESRRSRYLIRQADAMRARREGRAA